MPTNDQDPVTAYALRRPDYERFAVKLAGLLQELLCQSGIEVQAIEKRAKTIESFREKIERKVEQYNSPIDDVTDLAGVRLILNVNADVDRVSVLVDKWFDVDSRHSGDKRKQLEPDRFTYLSVHKVVRITRERGELPEWDAFKTFRAEVQIRTVLQHAWAVVSHKLTYKRGSEITNEFQRILNRLSAELESVDEQFTKLFETHTSRIAVATQHREPLTIDSIGGILKSAALARLVDAAESAGFHRVPSGYGFPDGSYLLSAAQAIGRLSTGDVTKDLDVPDTQAKQFFRTLYSRLGPLLGDDDFFGALVLVAKNHGAQLASQTLELWEHQLPAAVLDVGRDVFKK